MLIGRLDPALHQESGSIHAVFRANAHPASAGSEERLRATALGAYLVMRLLDRTLELAGTTDDALNLQRVSTVSFVDGLPTTVAECAHLRLILAALTADSDGPAWPHLRSALLRYAGWLEREGRLDLSLEALRLTARTWRGEIPPQDFTTLALNVGRVNRQLARLRLAQDAYDVAAEAAETTGDRVGQLRARLGAISVRRLRGEVTGLEAELRAVLAECESEAALTALLPLVHADIGALCTSVGRAGDAIRAMVRAARAAASLPERLQVLAGLGRTLLEVGYRDTAKLVLEHVASHAADRLVRATADLELMDVASTEGNRLAFERLRGSLGRYMWRLPATTRADFHYRSGLGLSRFSQPGRAARSWSAGRTLALEEGLDDWTGVFLRLEKSLPGCGEVRVESAAPASLNLGALLDEVHALIHPTGLSTMQAGAGPS